MIIFGCLKQTAFSIECLNKNFKKLVLIFSCLMSAAHADIAVIVNPINKDLNLTRTDVQSIFLGTKRILPNGKQVEPFDLPNTQNITQIFYKLVANKTSIELQTYWARANFTGQAVHPIVLTSDSAAIAKVANNAKAIAYVNSSLVKNNDKVAVALLIPTGQI